MHCFSHFEFLLLFLYSDDSGQDLRTYRVNTKSLDHSHRPKKIEKSIKKIPIWCQKTRYVLKFCAVILHIFEITLGGALNPFY